MVEGRERLRFAFEARDRIGIGRRQIGKDLDRDVAIQPAVVRPVDVAHPAGANRRENLVRSEACAGQKGHKEPARLYPPVIVAAEAVAASRTLFMNHKDHKDFGRFAFFVSFVIP